MTAEQIASLAERLAAAVERGHLTGPQATRALGHATFTSLGHNVLAQRTRQHINRTTLDALRARGAERERV